MAPPPRLSAQDEPLPRLGEEAEQARFRPQISLRALLFAVAAVGAVAGWFGLKALETRRERAIADELRPFGGAASWRGRELVQLTFAGEAFRNEALERAGALRRLERVVLIDLKVGAEGLQALKPLPRLRELKLLRVTGLDVDAVRAIGTLDALESLWLEECSLDDLVLGALPASQRLRSLNLIGAEVTDAGVGALDRFPALEELYLQRTGVTPAAIADLSRRLPQCLIHADRSPRPGRVPPTPSPAPLGDRD